MNNQQTQQARDPVCGMTVDSSKTRFVHHSEGVTWYFCAEHCLKQFQADPKKYALPQGQPTALSPQKKISLRRELLIGLLLFVAAFLVVIMGRGIARPQLPAASGAAVTGTPVGAHQAIDAGQGGVTVIAAHDSQATETVFALSLDTHTVDLTSFDPARQVRLKMGDQETPPDSTAPDGERSPHHQNYRLTFPATDRKDMSLLVRDVAGVNRTLPFNL